MSANNKDSGEDKAKPAIVLAAYLLANALFAGPAVANVMDGESTLLLSARSGGRAGGRAMSRPMRSMPSTSRSYAPARSTTIITPGYRIAPPPIIVSPFGMGYGYNPFGGFGLGYGMGAAGSLGNEVRDFNQEREIASSKAELEQTKAREAELEQRLKALEDAQTNREVKQ